MTIAGRLVDGKHLSLDMQAYLEHIHNHLRPNRTCYIGQSTTRRLNKPLNRDYLINRVHSPLAPFGAVYSAFLFIMKCRDLKYFEYSL
jgi:hypothetical protein